MQLFKSAFIRMMLICFTFFSVFSPSSLSVMAVQSTETAESPPKEHEETTSQQTQVWMSDTQYYSESYRHIFKRMTEWIVELLLQAGIMKRTRGG
ncbi:hypothetical protein RFB12_04390 [Parageobacillus toebii]|jgi:hypothetical protein|nr:hypothetical protein [Parageobacillus toebii]WMT19836.1 hypothetical protein RFB12_04390 [Parageobacillus toebii]